MRGPEWSALRGAAGCEFRMQARRRVVWIVSAVLGLLVFWAYRWAPDPEATVTESMTLWAQRVQSLLPIGVGVLLADRLPRDRRTKVGEILETTPAPAGARLLGKFVGATLATLVPILAVYAVGVGVVLGETRDWRSLPLALGVFAAINLPGLLFVGAFSIACPALLWVPLFQFLYVGYWFWGNLLPPDQGIPTLNGTLLTPIGDYMAAGFFGVRGLAWVAEATPWQGAQSVVLLIGSAAAALADAHLLLRWQQARL